VDVVLQFTRNLHTFEIADGAADAANDFEAISDPVNIVKSATVLLQTTIADVMLVYRCWVVYGRSWLAISLPLLLVLGNMAVTGVVLFLEVTLNQNALLNISKLKPFGAAFWALTIVINVITTGLIVARIWKINNGHKDFRNQSEAQSRGPRPVNKLQHVMRTVIESGLLYTGTSLITFITYVTNNIAVYVTTDVEVQVIGIAFNLIIIRAAQASGGEHYNASTEVGSRSRSQYPLQFVGTGTQSTVIGQHVNVTVTRDDGLSDPPDKFREF